MGGHSDPDDFDRRDGEGCKDCSLCKKGRIYSAGLYIGRYLNEELLARDSSRVNLPLSTLEHWKMKQEPAEIRCDTGASYLVLYVSAYQSYENNFAFSQ